MTLQTMAGGLQDHGLAEEAYHLLLPQSSVPPPAYLLVDLVR